MGLDDALWMACRAGGVHHGEIIVRVDLDLWRRIAAGTVAQGAEIKRGVPFGIPDTDPGQSKFILQGRQPFHPRAVGKDDTRPAVAEGIVELFRGPPRVEEHHHPAEGRDRQNQHQQFGIVAHRNRDLIALGQPQFVLHGMGHPVNRGCEFGVGIALILKGQIVEGAIPLAFPSGRQKGRHRRRDIGEGLHGHAPDNRLSHLEEGVRRDDMAHGLFGCHGRRCDHFFNLHLSPPKAERRPAPPPAKRLFPGQTRQEIRGLQSRRTERHSAISSFAMLLPPQRGNPPMEGWGDTKYSSETPEQDSDKKRGHYTVHRRAARAGIAPNLPTLPPWSSAAHEDCHPRSVHLDARVPA